MEKLNGVEIRVKFDVFETQINDDICYLGKLYPVKVTVRVQVLPGHNIIGFSVDGQKNIMLKKNLIEISTPGTACYKMNVQVKQINGVLKTEYSQNNMRLLEFLPKGEIRVWEIALIVQNDMCFLTTQATYHAKCYWDDNHVVCPQFMKWPQMMKMLDEQLSLQFEELEDIKSYQDQPAQAAENVSPKTGRVLWWNHAMGMGAIITPEVVARVHWSEIIGRKPLAFLKTGEIAHYKALNNIDSPFSQFKVEAKEVIPLKD